MPRVPRTFWAALVILFVLASGVSAQVTLAGLLNEMTDLEHLTRFPDPPFRLVQSSSIQGGEKRDVWSLDHRLGQDGSNVKDVILVSDDATQDAGTVLFSQDGPGALVRIWLRPLDQAKLRLRIYVDDRTKPTLEASLDELLEGRLGPVSAPFCEASNGAIGVMFPIPFARSCVVTLSTDDLAGRCAYQVTARLYSPDVRVEPFSPAAYQAVRPQWEQAAALWSRPVGPPGNSDGDFRVPLKLSRQAPSAELQVPRAGGGLVAELRLRPSSLDPAILRRTILAISFDGRTCVRTPLSDFFGAGPGSPAYQSLLASITPEGDLISHWPMPFLERARISLEGPGESVPLAERGRKPKGRLPFPLRFLRRKEESKKRVLEQPSERVRDEIEVEGQLLVRRYRWDGRSMYFHAGWQAQADLRTEGGKPWNALAISGKGAYVGTVLEVANPVRDRWVEGDDKIYVDGEEIASIVGTGTADFFGINPSAPEIFVRPLHGQTQRDGPKAFGHSSYYRWRLIDPIIFDNGLKMDFEFAHTNPAARISLGSVHYWYADANHSQEPLRISEAQATIPSLPERAIPRIAGAIEGESLVAVSFDGQPPLRESRIHFEEDGPWSGDAHLVWKGSKPGNQLVLSFDAPMRGRFSVQAYLSKSFDYGICRLAVNDQFLADPVDLYDTRPTRMGPIDLGVYELTPTDNRLKIDVVSSSRLASPKNCTFGLDCLVLTPAQP